MDLKQLREKQGLTIYDMAKRLGVSPQHISAIELGKREIPKNRIDEFQVVYGIGSNDIIEIKERKLKIKKVRSLILNATIKQLDRIIAFMGG